MAATQTRTLDPFTIEIISHRLYQITQEVGTTLERVGGTVNTTQRHDYITALYRANGDVLCAGESSKWHVACAGLAVKRIIERFEDDDGIQPGDMFMLNDPYVAAIHQSDVYIISPVHYHEQIVAWSATFVHVTDIGALSPGGNSPGAREICHEGVRIPGIKLIDRGKVRRDVFDAICNMTRQPALVGLDLKCEIAANNVARARIQDVCAQYGPDVVDAVAVEMIRYTEQILRKRLLEIPDGSWQAEGVIETDEAWKVVLKLTKTGDHLLFDFTGTDPQASVGVNLPYHGAYGKCFGGVLDVLGWDLPKNEGAFAPIEVIAPPGTLVNVQPPGPVSMNTTAGGAVVGYVVATVITQMAAASEKWRTEVIAHGQGHRRARHAGVNQHGWYYAAGYGGIGGSGARPESDGIDCGGLELMSDFNVEWFESIYPFLFLFRRQILDGGGAGKYRGGSGQRTAATIHDAPEGKIKGVAYGVAGLRNSGHGLFGGYPGAPSTLRLARNTRLHEVFDQKGPALELEALGGESTELQYSEFDLRPGDVLINTDSSGGGYGDPLDRDPLAVLDDVLRRNVSLEAARDIYGVILQGEDLDAEATILARARLREERSEALERIATQNAAAPGKHAREPADHPLRENLEVAANSGAMWVRCTQCGYPLCPADQEWTDACNRKLLPPTRAGAAMQPLESHFVLEQLYCPSCSALFDTEIVEAPS